MPENMTPENEQRMLTINRLELGVAIAGIVVGMATSYATFAILPYRVNEAEKKIVELNAQMQMMTRENAEQRELLIRMDERLKTVQRALKISTDE